MALYVPGTLPFARIGIIVAKRHYKRAVDRNLLRRLVRESFRHISAELPPVDIVFMFRSRYQVLDKYIIRKELDALWSLLSVSSNPSSRETT